jgi:protein-serine/threonine kinase
MKPTPESSSDHTIRGPPLRVVNGLPTPSSTTTTTIRLSSPLTQSSMNPVSPSSPTGATVASSVPPSAWPGAPIPAQAVGTSLPVPQELEEDEETSPNASLDPWAARRVAAVQPLRPRTVTPSLSTLEKAVSARIYFENLYFPLLRQQPSREQRRLAMERDMEQLGMSEAQCAVVRERWRKNETEYLRERRARVDVTSFVKLKTIGHGAFGVVSLVKEKGTGQLYAMKQLRKTDMLRKGQEGHVRAERDVLKGAALVGNPNGAEWIVRLFYSFQDRDHLYLVRSHISPARLSRSTNRIFRYWSSWAGETCSTFSSRGIFLMRTLPDSTLPRCDLIPLGAGPALTVGLVLDDSCD